MVHQDHRDKLVVHVTLYSPNMMSPVCVKKIQKRLTDKTISLVIRFVHLPVSTSRSVLSAKGMDSP